MTEGTQGFIFVSHWGINQLPLQKVGGKFHVLVECNPVDHTNQGRVLQERMAVWEKGIPVEKMPYSTNVLVTQTNPV